MAHHEDVVRQLEYSTYLGGDFTDSALAVAVDGAGLARVAGMTESPDFPANAYDPTFNSLNGGSDAFVAKLDTTKSGLESLVASTFLGAEDERGSTEIATGVAVDQDGQTYVTGESNSGSFPINGSPIQGTFGGQVDAFVSVFSDDLNLLPYSTYLGGEGEDYPREIAVDQAGRITVAGKTSSSGFPSENGLPGGSCSDDPHSAFVSRFDTDSSVFAYSTCLPGPSVEAWEARGVAVDSFGDAYVTGLTFPGGSHAQAFVAKLSGEGSSPGSELRFAAPSISWVEDEYAVGGYSWAMATVKRGPPLDTTVTVDYSTSDGTATAPADYDATSGTLTFYPGEAALPIAVPIVADANAETNETLTLTLSNPGPEAYLGAPSATLISIEDDDGLVRTLSISDAVLTVGPNWTAMESLTWLSLSAYAGTGPSIVTVTADPQGLAPGTYGGAIIVEGDTGNSPQVVQVTLKVP